MMATYTGDRRTRLATSRVRQTARLRLGISRRESRSLDPWLPRVWAGTRAFLPSLHTRFAAVLRFPLNSDEGDSGTGGRGDGDINQVRIEKPEQETE
ncbi:hypothetical protein CCHR01_15275 [Colletotrichum chrysophilum]|uniref:Uncharacterized protein n=1 Tax=Colletotrichum chrysophilum TaxID=1836956 RepID=A0AAD9A602_9PEZI|nr:hypothetical protein CCHR01_15275 [Colletotrichum chrysophilum]